jgi:UDP-N-acetylmuramoyl-tripeptide--D-alanyl-D-alanine ligase
MNPFRFLKRRFYFVGAKYFAFFARFVLRRWQPTIITVIGSSGKTTLLHLIEAQLGEKAVYSHRANSAFGIPFHILGIERETFSICEWLKIFLLAPFKIFRSLPKQKIYVTEADAERPGESELIAKLLRPHLLVWLSLGESHGANFDRLAKRAGTRVETAIAHEFGFFPEATRSAIILNKNNPFIVKECDRTKAQKIMVDEDQVLRVITAHEKMVFETDSFTFEVPALVPKEVGLSLVGVSEVLSCLKQPVDLKFSNFKLPPSRSSVLKGKNNTTLIDSTYNAVIDGVRSMLEVFADYPAVGEKWLVLGDMVDQGESEQAEHELLAELIKKVKPNRFVFVGPRLAKYTYPILIAQNKDGGYDPVQNPSFMRPDEALEFLKKNLNGGETILFKGARFLEGVVEKMLENPADAEKLCRREAVWVARRKEWGV